jgi:hypothetical protein
MPAEKRVRTEAPPAEDQPFPRGAAGSDTPREGRQRKARPDARAGSHGGSSSSKKRKERGTGSLLVRSQHRKAAVQPPRRAGRLNTVPDHAPLRRLSAL